MHVDEPHIPPTAVAERGFDLIGAVPDEPGHVSHSVLLQEFELVNGKRLVRHFDERFRNSLGNRPESRGQTSGKHGDRKAHASSTFVPSKSKRNRTSSRPALHMAARSRR